MSGKADTQYNAYKYRHVVLFFRIFTIFPFYSFGNRCAYHKVIAFKCVVVCCVGHNVVVHRTAQFCCVCLYAL